MARWHGGNCGHLRPCLPFSSAPPLWQAKAIHLSAKRNQFGAHGDRGVPLRCDAQVPVRKRSFVPSPLTRMGRRDECRRASSCDEHRQGRMCKGCLLLSRWTRTCDGIRGAVVREFRKEDKRASLFSRRGEARPAGKGNLTYLRKPEDQTFIDRSLTILSSGETLLPNRNPFTSAFCLFQPAKDPTVRQPHARGVFEAL